MCAASKITSAVLARQAVHPSRTCVVLEYRANCRANSRVLALTAFFRDQAQGFEQSTGTSDSVAAQARLPHIQQDACLSTEKPAPRQHSLD